MSEKRWSKDSWRRKEALQQPDYSDTVRLDSVIQTIEQYPPLVFPGEVDALKRELAEAEAGERFILQGGDCVERFIDCNQASITNQLKILLQMSVVLIHALRKPVIRIGRIAGQYSKPRSKATEMAGGDEILAYRGDAVNDFSPDAAAREPDADRLLNGYYHAAVTLNYIRSLIDGGFADLHHPYTWNLHLIEKTERWNRYREIVEQVTDAIRFMEAFGGANTDRLQRVQFYVSHEALLLRLEEALTRVFEGFPGYYNAGAHMLWIGNRTRSIDSAHVEYCRGIENPLGIKIDATISSDELVDLVRMLNPKQEHGKVMLITRFGVDSVRTSLRSLVAAVQKTDIPVLWACDPMHGNTEKTSTGIKTRNFDHILSELTETFSVHKELGSRLSGVHFELTGEDVTECTGGAVDVTTEDLDKNYQTYCDPRLNYSQSLEIAFLISRLAKTGR